MGRQQSSLDEFPNQERRQQFLASRYQHFKPNEFGRGSEL
jgi:hypothetical protein